MRRSISLLLAGAAAAFVAACSESAVAPARPDSSDGALATSARGRSTTTTVLGSFEISPAGGTYRVGAYDLVVPAGAVCDPSTTRYGARYWDDDCTPLSRSTTVRLVAETSRNRVSVDFQPDLRFRPGAGWVTLQTSAYRDLLTSPEARQLAPTADVFRAFAMLYVPSGGSSRIDEVMSTGDLSLVTYVDRNTGVLSRRIKHFSGYTVSLGFSCTDPTNTSCTDTGGSLPSPTGSLSSSTLASSLSVVVLP
jgi:hypothetical protein